MTVEKWISLRDINQVLASSVHHDGITIVSQSVDESLFTVCHVQCVLNGNQSLGLSRSSTSDVICTTWVMSREISDPPTPGGTKRPIAW